MVIHMTLGLQAGYRGHLRARPREACRRRRLSSSMRRDEAAGGRGRAGEAAAAASPAEAHQQAGAAAGAAFRTRLYISCCVLRRSTLPDSQLNTQEPCMRARAPYTTVIMRCSDLIDVSQYVNASMAENPWAALEKQHQRQHTPPPAAKPPPSTAAAGPSLADALAGAVQVRCSLQHALCVL